MKCILAIFKPFAIAAVVGVGLFLLYYIGQVRQLENKLQKSEVYEPIMQDVARICQSVGTNRLQGVVPASAKRVGVYFAIFTQNDAVLRGGGHDLPYSYRLTKDVHSSTGMTNVWHFAYRNDEYGTETPLATFSFSGNMNKSVVERSQ